MHKNSLLGLGAFALIVAFALPASAGPQRNVVRVPMDSYINQVNDAHVGSGGTTSVRYTPTKVKLTGLYGRTQRLSKKRGFAHGINNNGDAIGILRGEPVVFKADGSIVPITSSKNEPVWPTRIGDNGTIVGTAHNLDEFSFKAARITKGVVELYGDQSIDGYVSAEYAEFGYIDPGSMAVDVASDGTTLVQLIGVYDPNNGVEIMPSRLVLWFPDGSATMLGENVWGNAISDNGQYVVGSAMGKPVRWNISGASITKEDLATIDSMAYTYAADVNNTGEAVGTAWSYETRDSTGLYWSSPSTVLRVITLGNFGRMIKVRSATCITNNSSILAECSMGQLLSFQVYLRP